MNEYLKKNHKKYDHIIVFDFGHNLINSEVIKTLNKINKKIFINCQSNSSNFGFNLVNKYLAADTISMDEQEFRLSVQDKNKPIKDLIRSNKNFIKKFKNFIVTMGKMDLIIFQRIQLYLAQLFIQHLKTQQVVEMYSFQYI